MSFSSEAITIVTGEALDLTRSTYPSKPKRLRQPQGSNYLSSNIKRQRHECNGTSSKFKGVVRQRNGHWGAQIYAKHQRIWLGSFKTEEEAAMAYDSAAIKVRNGDSYRNLPWTNTNAQELNFQSQFNTEAVLNMIKDGSYASKFSDYLNVKLQIQELEVGSCDLGKLPEKEVYSCRKLFQKELTPSDVGKLNRLVIPKKNALRYFPHADKQEGKGEEVVELVFYDKVMRSWKFRYCYWKSSQSFVFTRGWNRFVKEKELKAKDTVIFSLYQCRNRVDDLSSFGLIDVHYHDRFLNNTKALDGLGENVGGVAESMETWNNANTEIEFKELAQPLESWRCSDVTKEDHEQNANTEIQFEELAQPPQSGRWSDVTKENHEQIQQNANTELEFEELAQSPDSESGRCPDVTKEDHEPNANAEIEFKELAQPPESGSCSDVTEKDHEPNANAEIEFKELAQPPESGSCSDFTKKDHEPVEVECVRAEGKGFKLFGIQIL